jgi:hypothetical protein
MFNIINATVYHKSSIPIKGLSWQRAEEQIGQLIHDYSEEVEWDESLGTLQINGAKHLPYNKQIWFPEGDAGNSPFSWLGKGKGWFDESICSRRMISFSICHSRIWLMN